MKPTDDEIKEYIMQRDVTIIDTAHHFLEQQANETSQDMITFDEWIRKELSMTGSSTYAECWEDARKGMIPAKNAITLPDESEWPKWANGVVTKFTEKTEDCFLDYINGTSYNASIKYIPRTKPQPIKITMQKALELLEDMHGKPVEIVE